MGSEIWDDGNTVSGDGCSADWSTIEPGYICSGSVCTRWTGGKSPDAPKSSCIIQCGDGFRAGSEVWDDGNTSSGDGCSSDWSTIESGYAWTGGSLTSKDTCTLWSAGFYPDSAKANWVPTWGDGLRAGSEAWDDANTSSGDGCSNDCTSIEVKYVWVGGSTTSKDTCFTCAKGYTPSSIKNQCVPIWGDGFRASPEAWDDGNTKDGDGWPSDCKKIDPGWVCFGGEFGFVDVCVHWDVGYSTNIDFSSCIGSEVSRDVKYLATAAMFAALFGIV